MQPAFAGTVRPMRNPCPARALAATTVRHGPPLLARPPVYGRVGAGGAVGNGPEGAGGGSIGGGHHSNTSE